MTNEDYIQAAIASRLDPINPSVSEFEYLEHTEFEARLYLAARNYVLYRWLKQSDCILTWKNLVNDQETVDFVEQQNVSLDIIEFAFRFCHRYRYINYGIHAFSR